MTLAVLFVLAELADLGTYLQAPFLESNPAMQGWPPAVVAAKFVALTAVAGLALIGLTGRKQTFTLGVCLAIAAFSFGTNAHALRTIDAAPTSALLAIPTGPVADAAAPEGHRVGSSGTDAARTPAPRPSAPGATVRGRASWYGVDGDVAAAGPALRHGHWRGSLVAVCADRCVTVKLVDFCQCLRGQRSERVIDLSPSAFARLAPLSAGLIRVTVSSVRVVPPATDR